ncbi:MAG TPA: TonB-dependent receptor [Steroidobacter sp.]|uniref:TonB-dependent receptor n=1 Tax=Steroidobacter sp. TaxID=1978227 RepID=UPI002EDAA8A2
MKTYIGSRIPLATGLSSLVLASFATSALSQDTASTGEQIAEVIVTGTRVPKAVDKIPGAITVIGEAELAHTQAVTLDATAVLSRTVPGYSESSQAMSNTGETLRGRIPLRLFDGVPQGSPLREGTRNGTFTDMGIVERIEVINGPSAAEGIGAAGGIINYISRSPTEEGTEVDLTARYSSQFENDGDDWKIGATLTHKQDRFDAIAAVSYVDRGMTYDGNGRSIGLNTSGSVADSESENLFFKGGMNFGANDQQRLQLSVSRFNITAKGNYILVDGDRTTGLTNTSVRGRPLGSKTEFNDFDQESLTYSHNDLFGGSLTVNAYRAEQAMRYVAEDGPDRQDPLIAPIGTLIDQSEIRTEKKGLRTAFARGNLFSVSGLEINAGIDLTEDVAEQRLALTNRVWVPPMEYTSVAPFAQLSYDIGPVTLAGGVRREDGELQVDDYTTTWARDRRFVEGGTLSYEENLPNFGVVWRVVPGLSLFASYSKGFTLPNVGIPLRNVQCSNDTPEGTQPDGCPNDPQQSVDGILDLEPIVVDNTEVGFNWRGSRISLGGSYYRSDSDFGVSLAVDPASEDFIMLRRPVEIEGYEFTSEFKITDTLSATALYSHTEGMTRTGNSGPLDREMGVNDITPDKIGTSLSWQFNDAGDVTVSSTTYLGRDLNEGRPGEEHTSGYTLFDLGANYRFGKSLVTLGVENVTDKFYILSWAQVPGFRNYWSGRGRVTSLTYTMKF